MGRSQPKTGIFREGCSYKNLECIRARAGDITCAAAAEQAAAAHKVAVPRMQKLRPGKAAERSAEFRDCREIGHVEIRIHGVFELRLC